MSFEGNEGGPTSRPVSAAGTFTNGATGSRSNSSAKGCYANSARRSTPTTWTRAPTSRPTRWGGCWRSSTTGLTDNRLSVSLAPRYRGWQNSQVLICESGPKTGRNASPPAQISVSILREKWSCGHSLYGFSFSVTNKKRGAKA